MAPAHRAVALDCDTAIFAQPYLTQDAPTQVLPRTQAGHVGGLCDNALSEQAADDGSDVSDHAAEAVERAAAEVTPPGVLQFEDLPSEEDFFSKGLGPDDTHILQVPGKQLTIQDKRFMHKVFLSGRSKWTVKQASDMKFNPPGTQGNSSRKTCPLNCIINLFKAFVQQHPRLAVFDEAGASLQLRDFPPDEAAQDRMHNECMSAMRLTLQRVSTERVAWMSASLASGRPRQGLGASSAVETVPAASAASSRYTAGQHAPETPHSRAGAPIPKRARHGAVDTRVRGLITCLQAHASLQSFGHWLQRATNCGSPVENTSDCWTA